MNDALLSTLKTIGAIIAAFYGVYATVTDFKVEKNGRKKLSLVGWIGLSILLTATVLNLSTDFISRQHDARQHGIESDARKKEEKAVAGIGENLSQELVQTMTLNHGLAKTSQAIESNVQISQKNATLSSETLTQTQRLLDPIKTTVQAFITLRIPRHQQAMEAFAHRINLDGMAFNPAGFIYDFDEEWPSKDDAQERDLFSFLQDIEVSLSFKSQSTPPRDYYLSFFGICHGSSTDNVAEDSLGWTTLQVSSNHDLQVLCTPILRLSGDDPDLKSYHDLLGKSAEIAVQSIQSESLADRLIGKQMRAVTFSVESFSFTIPDGRNVALEGLKPHGCPTYSTDDSCTTSLPINSFERNEFLAAFRKGLANRVSQKRHR